MLAIWVNAPTFLAPRLIYSQPALRFKLSQINTGRRIPCACGVSCTELLCGFLVTVGNTQWRVGRGITLLYHRRARRIHHNHTGFGLPWPLRRLCGFCCCWFGILRNRLATALARLRTLVLVNPGGHSGRIGFSFVGYCNALFPRYAFGE